MVQRSSNNLFKLKLATLRFQAIIIRLVKPLETVVSLSELILAIHQVLFSVPGGVSPLEAAHHVAAFLLQQGLVQRGLCLLSEGHRVGRRDPFRKKRLQTGLRRIQDSSEHEVVAVDLIERFEEQ